LALDLYLCFENLNKMQKEIQAEQIDNKNFPADNQFTADHRLINPVYITLSTNLVLLYAAQAYCNHELIHDETQENEFKQYIKTFLFEQYDKFLKSANSDQERKQYPGYLIVHLYALLDTCTEYLSKRPDDDIQNIKDALEVNYFEHFKQEKQIKLICTEA